MPYQTSDNAKRLARAHERRMGKSVMPLEIKPDGYCAYKVFDPETGSWTRWKDTGKKLVRLSEHDNS